MLIPYGGESIFALSHCQAHRLEHRTGVTEQPVMDISLIA